MPSSDIRRRVARAMGAVVRGVTAKTSMFAKRPPNRRRLSTMRSVRGSRIPDSMQVTTVVDTDLPESSMLFTRMALFSRSIARNRFGASSKRSVIERFSAK